MIARAIAVPELAMMFRESGLTENKIELQIRPRLPDPELEAAEGQVKSAVSQLKALRGQSLLSAVPGTLLLALLCFVVYSAAQRARWAKVKASKSQSRNGSVAPKRAISAAARKRMAVAQRARWAKVRAEKKAA